MTATETFDALESLVDHFESAAQATRELADVLAELVRKVTGRGNAGPDGWQTDACAGWVHDACPASSFCDCTCHGGKLR